MSKYLIKPLGSVWLNPYAISDLKKDLLLYDKLGMLNLHTLLEGLHQYKKYDLFQNQLNEVEYLIEKGVFIELKQLMNFAKKGSAMFPTDDMEMANYIMKLKAKISEITDEKERDKIYWQINELDTRLWSKIVNINNESVVTVPYLNDVSSFERTDTVKEKAYSIINKSIPLPSEGTSWEKIFDFKSDSESQLKLLALKNWINDLPENMSSNELEDKIQYLSYQYTESLKRHKISTRLITFKTIITALPKGLSELLRLRFDKAIEPFFEIAEQQVNFSQFKEREDLKGNELAYISLTNKKFNKTK
ncbi:hypothetical protein GCM10008015_13240 [Flavobacterium palustre]|uniref:Uncharacterized protein n=1 Tax=Flavobacterium palustre TaxID=1476463 RepID=A0ABQ1HFT2_9FLAO|nr:hypothetical protein [Flavobacterium palustre]GGA73920.1 hypothetical protein GCM10008015_13240 [Flavobacterium palustre]